MVDVSDQLSLIEKKLVSNTDALSSNNKNLVLLLSRLEKMEEKCDEQAAQIKVLDRMVGKLGKTCEELKAQMKKFEKEKRSRSLDSFGSTESYDSGKVRKLSQD